MTKVSVFIPTKNGEEYIEQTLKAVFAQKHNFDLDVVIIDSGSCDRTLQIVQSFPIKLKQIPAYEFNHGATRNLGISLCKGEFVALLTQDATPANCKWLKNIIQPMLNDSKTAYVYGPHLPRQNCNPFEKRNLEAHFNIFLGSKFRKDYLLPKEKIQDTSFYHAKIFASNCNSAIRKSVHKQIPFKPVNMAEDQAWAIDIMRAGFKKVYAPKALVLHSHNYTPKQYFYRFFDEYQSHKQQKNYQEVKSFVLILPRALALTIRDIAYIAKQQYNFFKKFYWYIFVLRVNINRMLAAYLGAHYEKLPKWLYNKLSMQKRIIKQ